MTVYLREYVNLRCYLLLRQMKVESRDRDPVLGCDSLDRVTPIKNNKCVFISTNSKRNGGWWKYSRTREGKGTGTPKPDFGSGAMQST